MMQEEKNIVIVGGGITGLTAAYQLQKRIKEMDLPYTIKLIEASSRLGGKIQTIHKDGFTIERGPDSFLSRKKPAVQLVEELGLTDQLIQNATGQSYILVKNKLHKIPSGSFMGIPTELRSYLFSGLVSTSGKLRASLDYVIPKGKEKTDQSLGFFFRRRFGDELVDHLIEPLLSGIYSGDIDEMSLLATFPNFYHLEQKYGSLVRGLKQTMPKTNKKAKKKSGMFYSFKNGLETVVKTLEQELNRQSIVLNTTVDHIEKKEHVYHVLLDSGDVYKADAVLMATPHNTLSKIFSQYKMFEAIKDVPSTSVANVALAFDASAIKKEIYGTGFVVSRNSNFRITACTWTHRKWPTSTPLGKVLLRCYVGRPNDEEIVDLSDEEIIQVVLKDLNKTMKIRKKPEFTVITRWKHAMPQYTVGHLERLEKIRAAMKEKLPGVWIAGSSYEGVGIPDCIEQGRNAANHIVEYVMKKL